MYDEAGPDAENDPFDLRISITYEGTKLNSEPLFLSLLNGLYRIAQRPYSGPLFHGVFRDTERALVPGLDVNGPYVSQNYHAIWALEALALQVRHDEGYSSLKFQAFDKSRQQRVFGQVYPQPESQPSQVKIKSPDANAGTINASEVPPLDLTGNSLVSSTSLDGNQSPSKPPENALDLNSVNSTDAGYSSPIPRNFHTLPSSLPSGKLLPSNSALLVLIKATAAVAGLIQQNPPTASEYRDGGVVLQILRNVNIPGLQNGWLKQGFLDMAHELYDNGKYRDIQMILMVGDKQIGWITMYNNDGRNVTQF
ncbi:uncharacterized protein KY384_003353 [Bacidia gigantensis]|uniref:uncharacterized protein n=1 Tax=Bacidia gigantensis TaxID=2732470 RepID=UPI001D040400|nr:uncharacterized protein KY384_003353 [Bacidia gigantensis]KAG8531721.1 hypothetical protein KY384_003353 [Bacidia gigantensis]